MQAGEGSGTGRIVEDKAATDPVPMRHPPTHGPPTDSTMIGILHGYLLEGSGSNIWTRSIVRALCRAGETVHLVCQEPHAEDYDTIGAAYLYEPDGTVRTLLERDVPYPGRCIMHKPYRGDTLPVYVRDDYEEFPNAVPMVELPDAAIDDYLERNVRVVERVVCAHGITVLHANHAVLMSVVAQRVAAATGIGYAVMPHGSALEYAVKKDVRFLAHARDAFATARTIFVIGPEMRARVCETFGAVDGIEDKLVELNLGVDTSLFAPLGRAARAGHIARLAARLETLPSGRTRAQTEAMLDRLDGGMDLDALTHVFAPARAYDGKCADADAARRLSAIDWAAAPVLVFVGRLIAAKGPQSIIAALPALFAEVPKLAVVVVGHGPLREPLEALVWALGRSERELVEGMVRWGTALEGGPEKPFPALAAYLARLEAEGTLDRYFTLAREHLAPERVTFTGYLAHDELSYLFPCCDLAIFPSVVREAGPLVFLEAMASGCFPMGTYFGGMAASIDAAAESLGAADANAMKIGAEAVHTVADIGGHAPRALALGPRHRDSLRAVAVLLYDWGSVAEKLSRALDEMGSSPMSKP